MEKETNNKLLGRREVVLHLESEKNPGFSGASKAISEKYKVEESHIAVKKVDSRFGRNTFLIEANIYSDAKHKDSIEPKKKEKKKAGGQ